MGKTSRGPQVSAGSQKHPHACGEDADAIVAQLAYEETPPRMWGRLFLQPLVTEKVRNTPTHVGKTKSKASPIYTGKKHPHACGEDLSSLLI